MSQLSSNTQNTTVKISGIISAVSRRLWPSWSCQRDRKRRRMLVERPHGRVSLELQIGGQQHAECAPRNNGRDGIAHIHAIEHVNRRLGISVRCGKRERGTE